MGASERAGCSVRTGSEGWAVEEDSVEVEGSVG